MKRPVGITERNTGADIFNGLMLSIPPSDPEISYIDAPLHCPRTAFRSEPFISFKPHPVDTAMVRRRDSNTQPGGQIGAQVFLLANSLVKMLVVMWTAVTFSPKS